MRLIALLALAAALAAAEPVRFAFPSGINGQLAKVIEKAGLAEARGFAPTFTFFQYGPPMIEALAAGQVDVLFTSYNPVASYLAKAPGGLTVVADVGSAIHAIVVPDEAPARTLADLRGRKLAVSFNSDLHVDVLRSLRDAGIEPGKDIELLNVQPQELGNAFEQRLVDAVDIRVPPLHVLVNKKGGRIVQQWPWHFLVAVRSGWLKENPGAAERLREVVRDGIWRIAQRPDEAAAWWGEQLRLDPAAVRASADLNPLYKAARREDIDVAPGPQLRQRAEAWVRSLLAYGILKKPVEFVYE